MNMFSRLFAVALLVSSVAAFGVVDRDAFLANAKAAVVDAKARVSEIQKNINEAGENASDNQANTLVEAQKLVTHAEAAFKAAEANFEVAVLRAVVDSKAAIATATDKVEAQKAYDANLAQRKALFPTKTEKAFAKVKSGASLVFWDVPAKLEVVSTGDTKDGNLKKFAKYSAIYARRAALPVVAAAVVVTGSVAAYKAYKAKQVAAQTEADEFGDEEENEAEQAA